MNGFCLPFVRLSRSRRRLIYFLGFETCNRMRRLLAEWLIEFLRRLLDGLAKPNSLAESSDDRSSEIHYPPPAQTQIPGQSNVKAEGYAQRPPSKNTNGEP